MPPKKPKKITQTYLQNAGLYYLQRFPASRGHFQFIMMRKIHKSIEHHGTPSLEEAQTYLEHVTTYFEKLGLLNDKQYAHALAASLFRKGLSQKMIAHRLKTKKIDDMLIKETLENILPDNGDLIAAIRLLKRRRRGIFSRDQQQATSEKTLGILARAGFSYQTAQRALDFSYQEAEALLSEYA